MRSFPTPVLTATSTTILSKVSSPLKVGITRVSGWHDTTTHRHTNIMNLFHKWTRWLQMYRTDATGAMSAALFTLWVHVQYHWVVSHGDDMYSVWMRLTCTTVYLLIMYSACIELAGCLPVRYHCKFWMHIAYLLAYFIHADVPAAVIVVYSHHCVWGCHWKLTVVIWTRCHSTYLLGTRISLLLLYIHKISL